MSVELTALLKGVQLTNKPWIEGEWPNGDWEALVCNAKQACRAYCKSVEGWRKRERAQRFLLSLLRYKGRK